MSQQGRHGHRRPDSEQSYKYSILAGEHYFHIRANSVNELHPRKFLYRSEHLYCHKQQHQRWIVPYQLDSLQWQRAGHDDQPGDTRYPQMEDSCLSRHIVIPHCNVLRESTIRNYALRPSREQPIIHDHRRGSELSASAQALTPRAVEVSKNQD